MERQERAPRSRAAAPASPSRPRGTLILDALERLLAHAPLDSLDVEAIATEAGITRTRFYAYYTSKNDALAALLRRMIDVRNAAYQHPDSWFAGRGPEVRPRDAVRATIEMAIDVAWPHRFVLREACDLWTAAPEVRDAWLDVINAAAGHHEAAIIRERERGVAPQGCDARHTAEALAWQAERLCFRAWAQLPGAMSRNELAEVCLEAYMRMIFLADDPDPERIPLPHPAAKDRNAVTARHRRSAPIGRTRAERLSGDALATPPTATPAEQAHMTGQWRVISELGNRIDDLAVRRVPSSEVSPLQRRAPVGLAVGAVAATTRPVDDPHLPPQGRHHGTETGVILTDPLMPVRLQRRPGQDLIADIPRQHLSALRQHAIRSNSSGDENATSSSPSISRSVSVRETSMPRMASVRPAVSLRRTPDPDLGIA